MNSTFQILKCDVSQVNKMIIDGNHKLINYLVGIYPKAKSIDDVLTYLHNPIRENYTYLCLEKKNDVIIGDCHVVYFKDDPEDMRGGPFIQELKRLAPEFYDRFKTGNFDKLAIWITSINVRSEYSHQRVGQFLIRTLVDDSNPMFVFSETKTIPLVISTAKELKDKFDTYWGGVGVCSDSTFPQKVFDAYFRSHGNKDGVIIENGTVVCKYKTNGHVRRDSISLIGEKYAYLKSVVDQINKVNDGVNDAVTSGKTGENMYTCMAPLISIAK